MTCVERVHALHMYVLDVQKLSLIMHAHMHFRVHFYTRICILTVSVSEVLPKDKKIREDKIVMIGVASVDLSPLLQGEMMDDCMHSYTGILHKITTYQILFYSGDNQLRGEFLHSCGDPRQRCSWD